MTSVRQELPTKTVGKARTPSRGTATSRRTEASGKAVTGRAKGTRVAADGSTTTNKEAKKRGRPNPPRRTGRDIPSTTKVAQVRLQPDEAAALEAVVRRLNLGSTSEALREGLRLLMREAAETQAADEIQAFYEGKWVPLPDGVAPATEAELRAGDEAEW